MWHTAVTPPGAPLTLALTLTNPLTNPLTITITHIVTVTEQGGRGLAGAVTVHGYGIRCTEFVSASAVLQTIGMKLGK